MFDGTALGLAHHRCMRMFVAALNRGVPHIVVDNTNITVHSVNKYVMPATVAGYFTEVIRMVGDPVICASRNIHGVPEQTVIKMARQIEDYAGELIPEWGDNNDE